MKRLTQRQIGVLFGISQSRVKQIEHAALEKIRRAIITEAARKGQTVRQWLMDAA